MDSESNGNDSENALSDGWTMDLEKSPSDISVSKYFSFYGK
jgi:hypothetical protein